MKRRIFIPAFLLLAAALLAGSQTGRELPRFFDSAGKPSPGTIRLAIFYPSVGTLRDLEALRENGLIPAAGLEVIGLHHEKERTDYSAAEKFVRDHNLDWVHFHTLTAELGPQTIFKKNAASAELEKIFGLSSGVIFFGGPDIIPSLYGAKTNLRTVIEDPWRHYLELTAVFHLLGGAQDPAFKGYLESRPDFPVLGICLGLQTLNVGTGGTLVQDIWTETYGLGTFEDVIALGPSAWHTNPYRRIAVLEKDLLPYMFHPVRFADRSRIAAALGLHPSDRPAVMSAHHQAALRVGRGFRTAATSLDGKVVEAIEHARFPNVLGTQFHPEFSMLWKSAPEFKIAPADRELFGGRTYLETHPPSLEFHKRLWAWFMGALVKG